MIKIGLLAGKRLSKFRLNTLTPILEDKSFSIELAVIDDAPKKTIIQKLKKNIRRGRGGYIFIMAYQKFFSKRETFLCTEKLCKDNGISILKTKDIYSPETVASISRYNLDVFLFIGGYGILKEPVLKITRWGVLSYHHGNMRKYRGQPPGLWELFNDEKEIGITVQILTSGLDCGIPIEEKTIGIKNYETLKTLRNTIFKESEDMMYSALKKLSTNDFVPTIINSFGKVYTLPNLRQWIMLNIKVLWRRIK